MVPHNNVVIYNIPEGAEGSNVYDCSDFVKKFVVEHMRIEEASQWEIERAHRTPTGPPRLGRIRPIHVKFLRYKDRLTILKAAPKKLKGNPYHMENNPRSYTVFISDDVTEKVRKERKQLAVLKKKVQEKWPGKRVFIPYVVPPVLLREDDSGSLIRMKPGDVL